MKPSALDTEASNCLLCQFMLSSVLILNKLREIFTEIRFQKCITTMNFVCGKETVVSIIFQGHQCICWANVVMCTRVHKNDFGKIKLEFTFIGGGRLLATQFYSFIWKKCQRIQTKRILVNVHCMDVSLSPMSMRNGLPSRKLQLY